MTNSIQTIAAETTNIFITSDTHFGHANIIKYCHRPFLNHADQAHLDSIGGRWHNGSWKGPGASSWRISDESVELMNDALIKNINDLVPEDGILIHLGDFSTVPQDKTKLEAYHNRCAAWRSRINCRKVHIIWGNHDEPSALRHIFQWSGTSARLVANPHIIIFHHYAQLVWDWSHRSAWHCYGHSHGELEQYLDKMMPGRRSMDVGVDNAARLLGEYRPFRLEEIVGLLKDRPGFKFHSEFPTDDKSALEGANISD
jgi:calcineurin-like phosphoesterase family protein